MAQVLAILADLAARHAVALLLGLVALLLAASLAGRGQRQLTLAWIVVTGGGALLNRLLQVHWFSDVLARWANAAAWPTLCIGGLEAIRLASRPASC